MTRDTPPDRDPLLAMIGAAGADDGPTDAAAHHDRYLDGAQAGAVTIDDLRYDDRGLVPAIVQQHDSGEVLMLAWMTREALAETLERGETVFWSRSRGERWHKGETSGNVQRVVEVVADCDADVVLVRVDQRGPGPDGEPGSAAGVACHTGARSCFFTAVQP